MRSMTRRMTKEEAQSWMARWRAVEERQRSELRQETYDEKLRALAVLMASAALFDFRKLDAEDEVVRARWARLQTLASKR